MAVNKNFVVRNGLEVGGDTLFANGITDKVGIGTTNPTSTFTVKGGTSLQELSVSGVSTFTNNVAIGTSIPKSTLTVAGSGTSTSQLYVTGLSTFRNNAYITDQNRLYFGDESLSISYQVVGITSANYIETFDHIPLNIITENLTVGASDGEIYANFKINSSVSLFYDNAKKFETSGLGVTVTGVTSTTYLYATGISTFINGPVFIGSGTSTGTASQGLQVTGGGYFSSPVGIGITNPSNTLTVVGSGTSTSQLYVTGFSTFVGYSTFRDYVNIEDGIYVAGVSTFVGFSTFQNYVNIEDGIYVAGVSTFVGCSTFRDYVNIEDGIYVAGVSTFAGITTVTGTTLFTKQFSVSGVSTHVGISTFESTLFANQLSVSGISTLGITTVTNLSSQKLEVFGDGRLTGILTASSFSPSSGYIKAADGTNSIYIFDTTGNVSFQGNIAVNQINTGSGYKVLDFDGTTTPSVNITNKLNVGTAGTVITTTHSGNVGVGTTNPTSKFTVKGNTSLETLNVSGDTTITGNLNATNNYYVKLARLADQTIPNAVDTLVQFTATSDVNGWYSGITTRTIPTVAGAYRVDVMVNWEAGSITNDQTNIQIRKNGTTFSVSQVGIHTFSYTQNACGIVTMNGTTDYIDFTVYTANPTNQVINGTPDGAWTKMEIVKIN
jgi:hypothetical protein